MAYEFDKKPGAFETAFMACMGVAVALIILAVLLGLCLRILNS